MSTNNKLMPIPFADKAGETYKYSIPNTNDTTYPNKATYENGFPAVTMTDIAAGGMPPFGQDFNGVLNDITTAIRYMQAGNYQLYNTDFATSIGGYSKGAVILGSDNKIYESTIDSNTNDPISGPGWTLHLNYLPLTGGTITGKTTISYSAPELDLMAGSNSYVMRIFSASTSAGFAFTGTDNSVKTRIRFTRSTETINIENSKLTIDGASVLTTSGGTVSGNTNFTGKLQQDGNDVITTANVSSYVTPNVEYWYVNGSEASPATITTNQEIVIDNPYYGKSVSLIPQAYITGRDGTSRWIDCPFNYENSNSNGVSVNQIESNLYILGANNYIFYSSKLNTGLPSGILPSGELKSAQFRIKIIK